MGKNTIRDLGIAILLLLAAFFAPAVGSLDRSMVSAVFLIAFSLFLWINQPIPIGVTSLLVIILMPVLGLTGSLQEAFAGYSTPSNYFVIASFGVAIAIRKTTIPSRILNCLLSFSQGNYKSTILAYMAMTYIISTIMSDIAAVMIAIAFAMDLLEGISNETKKRQLGRVLLISLPFASVTGGIATPAGSTVNVMALNILSANTGMEVSFLEWCLLGFPISLILLFVSWFVLIKFYPAEDLSTADLGHFLEKVHASGPSVMSEKAVITVLIFMIAAWIAGTWIKPLNTTTVAIIGLLLMFLPGINAFTWKEFVNGVHWEIFLMGGTAISLGNLARQIGLVTLFADWCQSIVMNISEPILIGLLGAIVTLVLMVVPVGPATVSMLTMPVYAMTTALGFNPLTAVVTVGIFASNSTILPLNSVMLLSYAKGYWKMSEVTRVGIIFSLCWISLAALWFPVVSSWIFN